MILETFPVGPLQCNCTLLGDEQAGEAIVIDPGDEIGRIHHRLSELGLKLRQGVRVALPQSSQPFGQARRESTYLS